MLKEYSDLTPVGQGISALRGTQHEMADLAELIADPGSDAEMRTLAESEFHELKEKLPDLEHALKILLLPKDEADARNAIPAVRAGTAGTEAALFAAPPPPLSQRYPAVHCCRLDITHTSPTQNIVTPAANTP